MPNYAFRQDIEDALARNRALPLSTFLPAHIAVLLRDATRVWPESKRHQCIDDIIESAKAQYPKLFRMDA